MTNSKSGSVSQDEIISALAELKFECELGVDLDLSLQRFVFAAGPAASIRLILTVLDELHGTGFGVRNPNIVFEIMARLMEHLGENSVADQIRTSFKPSQNDAPHIRTRMQ